MQLIKERQINPIESEVLARISIIRPILTSLLIGIKQDVVDEMGGMHLKIFAMWMNITQDLLTKLSFFSTSHTLILCGYIITTFTQN